MTTPHQPPPGWPTADQAPAWQLPTPTSSAPAVHQAAPLTEYVRDPHTGVLTRVIQPSQVIQPAPVAEQQRHGIDPVAQRILAAGAVSPLVGWGGALLFGAMAGATTAIALLAVCLVVAWAMQSGGRRQGAVNVNVRIDNRRRG